MGILSLGKRNSSQNGVSKGVQWFDVHFKMSSVATLKKELKRREVRVEIRQTIRSPL